MQVQTSLEFPRCQLLQLNGVDSAWSQRLLLNCDKPFPSFASNFKLRPSTEAALNSSDADRMFSMFDLDGDGKVTREELRAVIGDVWGGDGIVAGGDGEGGADDSMYAGVKSAADEMLALLDTDDDGTVTAEEFARFRSSIRVLGSLPGADAATAAAIEEKLVSTDNPPVVKVKDARGAKGAKQAVAAEEAEAEDRHAMSELSAVAAAEDAAAAAAAAAAVEPSDKTLEDVTWLRATAAAAATRIAPTSPSPFDSTTGPPSYVTSVTLPNSRRAFPPQPSTATAAAVAAVAAATAAAAAAALQAVAMHPPALPPSPPAGRVR